MPSIVYDIINLIASLIRLLGMAVFGLGLGWLALELVRKNDTWPVQITIFLGLAGFMIGMTFFSAPGALGALAAGIGAAILIWGLPKKKVDEEKP
jgi:uncharacterized membrane protein YeaQ/YmgE (transglycosylase-associated protein family)